MIHRNLIGLMVAASLAAQSVCASTPAASHPAERQDAAREFDTARQAFAQCVRAAIPRLDDGLSPSDDVAHAAMKGCSKEYTNMVQAAVAMFAPTCGGGPDCTQGALANAQRGATQVATDEVIAARVSVAGAQVLKCQ